MNDNILEMAKSPLDKFNDNLFSIEKSTCGNFAEALKPIKNKKLLYSRIIEYSSLYFNDPYFLTFV